MGNHRLGLGYTAVKSPATSQGTPLKHRPAELKGTCHLPHRPKGP